MNLQIIVQDLVVSACDISVNFLKSENEGKCGTCADIHGLL